MQNRVLKPAVFSLLQGGVDAQAIDWDKREIKAWWQGVAQEFTSSWSTHFFPWLWGTADEQDDQVARRQWLTILRDGAQATLNTAMQRYPGRRGRRFRARAIAEDIFVGSLYRNFDELKEASRGTASSD